MAHWLFKSEPDTFSFEDLKSRPGKREPWSGVRNYQARNYMRDEMEVGDLCFFYHSSCPEPGVAGVIKVASKPYADPTQFEPGGDYEDPKSTAENPRWMLVDVEWVEDFASFVSLEKIRATESLAEMKLLQKGSRLSISPVTAAEFKAICKMGKAKAGKKA